MIDKEKARKAFLGYTSDYNADDIMIRSKISHTLIVADNAGKIAESLDMEKKDIDYAWLLGLLHDFGRFEQVRQYGTFVDAHSVDHAELGADILFKEGKIDLFIAAGLNEDDLDLTETAIRQHNKLTLCSGLDKRAKTLCEVLRDADKTDIFRMVDELSLKERAGSSMDSFVDRDEASKEIMECVYGHRCIPRNIIMSPFELHVSHICLAFELVYERSRIIVKDQGYLKHLLSLTDDRGDLIWKEKESRQLKIINEEIEKTWKIKL